MDTKGPNADKMDAVAGAAAGSGWVEVATADEFQNTDRKLVDLGEDRQVGLFKLDDGFHAISAWCSHQKASLVQGDLEDGEIMCPLHGARFDVRTGKNLSLPAVKPVKRYEVRLEGEKILLNLSC